MQIWILQVVCGNIHIYQNTEQKQVEDLNDKQCNYNNRRHVSVICHTWKNNFYQGKYTRQGFLNVFPF